MEKRNLPKRSRYYQGMIDLNLIERGADYSALRRSYVIFICTFDYFGQGLHKYSFENICKEMPKLRLKDETEKIFLCAAGTKNDVSKEMQDFLNYLTGREVVSSLAQRLEREVDRARKHEEWRQESLKQRGSG